MKAFNKTHYIAAVAMLAIISFASQAFAAADYYLKIESPKGESKIVHCPDGSCTIDNLAPGTYAVSIVDKSGKAWIPSNFRFDMSLTCRKAGAEQKDFLAVGAPTTQTTSSSEVTAPRDVATGMATGRRMHKPFTISKTTDKATPMLTITAPQNESGEGGGDAGVAIHWTLEVRVQRIEMK